MKKGIYALIHRPSGRVFIGASSNLSLARAQRKTQLLPGFTEIVPGDWEFRVIERLDGADPDELKDRRDFFIEETKRRAPDRLINGPMGPRVKDRGQTLSKLSHELGISFPTLLARWKRGDRGDHLRRPLESYPGGKI